MGGLEKSWGGLEKSGKRWRKKLNGTLVMKKLNY